MNKQAGTDEARIDRSNPEEIESSPIWKTNPEQWVEYVLSCAQKVRSIQLEAFGDLLYTEEMLESLDPWLFGEKCIIPALTLVARSGHLSPGDGMNLATVISRSPGLYAELTGQRIEVPEPIEFFKFLTERRLHDLERVEKKVDEDNW